MTTERPRTPTPYYPGAAVLVSLALGCVLVLAAGLTTLLGGSYFTTPGFQTIAGSSSDIAVAGMKVWHLDKLVLLLALAAWLTTGVLLLYKVLRHPPSLLRGSLLGLAIALLLLAFSPRWQDFQVRAYDGPSQATRYQLGTGVFPLFAHSTVTDTSTWYGEDDNYYDTETYLCVAHRKWKILSLVIDAGFYPILDDEHQHQLLQERCQRLPDE